MHKVQCTIVFNFYYLFPETFANQKLNFRTTKRCSFFLEPEKLLCGWDWSSDRLQFWPTGFQVGSISGNAQSIMLPDIISICYLLQGLFSLWEKASIRWPMKCKQKKDIPLLYVYFKGKTLFGLQIFKFLRCLQQNRTALNKDKIVFFINLLLLNDRLNQDADQDWWNLFHKVSI